MRFARWAFAAFAAVAVLAVGLVGVVPQRSAAETPRRSGAAVTSQGGAPLGHSGRWLTDAQGRTVILHGFNMAMKTAPYDPASLGFGEQDAAFLAAHGFNAVRLNLVLTGLEPQPGVFDDAYLASMVNTVHTLARHGIRTLVVFPEEVYNTQFKGEGFPDWMVDTDGIPPGLINTSTFANFFTNPALLVALDNFWNNAKVHGKGLQDWYAEAWAHVARAFSGEPSVLGYDMYNEPWPGTAYPTCLPPLGCPGWEIGKLRPFYQKVNAAIRTADPTHLTFYEPDLMAPFGTPSYLGRAGDGRSGLSFHMYCVDLSGNSFPAWVYSTCDGIQGIVMKQALNQVGQTGDALIMSEFGSSPKPAEIGHVIGLADRSAVPWLEWTYCQCGDPTDGGTVPGLVYDLRKPRSGSNVNAGNLAVEDEPYPQVVGGVPQSFGFDPATRTFTLTYRPNGTGDTVVYTSALQFPKGYRITLTGASATPGPGGQHLTLHALPGASSVTLTLIART